MVNKEAVIKNRHGIHCRPSAVIMKAIEGYNGEIHLIVEKDKLKLESVFSLLSLGLKPGDRINIEVEGPDQKVALEKLVNLFEFEYDFPPKEEQQHFDPEELARQFKLA